MYRRRCIIPAASNKKNIEDINYDLREDLGQLPGYTSIILEKTGKNPVIEILQQDKYIFHVLLSNGEKIIAEKKSPYRSWWVFSYKEKKYNSAFTNIEEDYLNLLLADFS